MEYQKPELNQLGATESLVLGHNGGSHSDNPQNGSNSASAFEFED